MKPSILAERIAWHSYRHYIRAQLRHRSGNEVFQGDAKSHGLWDAWKAAWDLRRLVSIPFTRRQRRWSYR